MKSKDTFASKENHGRIRNRVTPILYVILSFIGVIFVGSLLLVLPAASSDPSNSLSYIDAFFLSVSSVCVTGLSTVTIATALSVFGKIVIACLMQIGGLGLVTIISFFWFAAGIKINISQAMVVKEALSQPGYGHLRPLIKHVILITAGFEVLGTILNMFVFGFDYPFWEALGISMFHAISSFNNAGFDIIGAESLVPYANNFLLNFSTCLLIIAGGLGFLVFEDFFTFRKWRKFSLQTRIVLLTNLFVLLVSILIVYALQFNNMTFMEAVFYSINLRTAGFTTINNKMILKNSTVLVSNFFMVIGGSPFSTAGGIKTTTLFVILGSLYSSITGKKTLFCNREITDATKIKAFFLVVMAVFEIILGATLISIFENESISLEYVLYECCSAFGTVGLSLGITSSLSVGSKIILCALMFTGRVGPSMLISAFNLSPYKPNKAEVGFLGIDLMIG